MTNGNVPATPPRSTLVVTAHAGDFVWRAAWVPSRSPPPAARR